MSIYDAEMKVTIFRRSVAAPAITSHLAQVRDVVAAGGCGCGCSRSAITSLGVISSLRSQFTRRKLRQRIGCAAQPGTLTQLARQYHAATFSAAVYT